MENGYAVHLQPAKASDRGRGPGTPSIVVVDDRAAEAELMGELVRLPPVHARPTVFVDPREALAHMQHNRPDLLLTDLRMPHMDGLQLIRQARRIAEDLPCILTSGVPDAGEEACAAGLDMAFLVKPFDVDIMLATTQRIMGSRRSG